MAIRAGKATVTNTPQALSVLFAGIATFHYSRFRCSRGSIYIGSAGVDEQTGAALSYEQFMEINANLPAAEAFFVGNGILEFFGVGT